ncbi:adenylate/guanylate cyclase domain-containing protein [Cohnella lubricantis]|uniref:Adenylate/guanylate cyclase domain-containing protein n=1 Tax=Cohnella lubricantis TaxID=2163172 RepID=A0A841TFU4_9BACL|nr:adenylate/guanylate cyclase domain-containing protein [Cohnella lubricantis]MBB6678100.1 adenylate/guanylate cyclase domain-containing protein [Cohnella lubricantis]MBP2120462.1 class 3 adenylate cyclase [Cohnella lubricantis]
MNGYLIFSDLKGFSKLTEPEIRIFYKEIMPQLSERLKPFIERASVWNTWGDAVVAVYESGHDAVGMALLYRDLFKEYKYHELGITKLYPRIAGHYGEFEYFDDPLLQRRNVLGTNVNTTARIEPITRPGEVFVSKQFKEAIENLPEKVTRVSFDELGEIELAKNFGVKEIYRLYRNDEPKQIIDRILRTDLSWALPEAPKMSEDESKTINFYKNAPNKEILQQALKSEQIEGKSGHYIIELADICKSFGFYEEAITYIQRAEQYFLDINEIKVYPFKHQKRLLKIKANCLTRIGEYESAADIVYGLWQLGARDSDTLSMLAAQYKRRAIFENGRLLKYDEIRKELLERARDLYLEAFRLNIEEYYPAINVAYLYKLMGGMEAGKGNKLAGYILQSWGHRKGEDWWMDSTLAEAELIQDDLEPALDLFQNAVKNHNPTSFERRATSEQIQIYAHFTNQQANVEPILKILE